MKRAIFQTTGFVLLFTFIGCGEKPVATNPSVDSTNLNGAGAVKSAVLKQRPTSTGSNTTVEISQTSRATAQQVPAEPARVIPPTNNTVTPTATNAPLENGQPAPAQPPPELLARAQGGDVEAQRALGKFYSDAGDKKESTRWYEEAANK